MSSRNHSFSPLLFLASLGAGGISVIPFAIFQYMIPHEKGLVTLSMLKHGTYSLWKEAAFRGLEGVMVLFVVLHLVLTIHFLGKYLSWRKTTAYREMLGDPTRNTALLAPYISALMTMNTFLAGVRFFVPMVSKNLQTFMGPAFGVWMLIWTVLILTVLRLLKTAFSTTFDVRKINFGWLLYPFALAMLAVTGTGFAAVAKSHTIAHLAALFSLVPLTMAFFLFIVKIVTIFTGHLQADNMPEKQFMPSFLSAIPVITLMAISFFRLGHYMHTHLGYHIDGSYYFTVTVAAYAFEIWYMLFGLSMMSSYFRRDFFKNEYYFSQWALVCPFVAFAVLGAFVYKTFTPSVLFPVMSAMSLGVAMFFFGRLLYRHFICNRGKVPAGSAVQVNSNETWQCA